MLHGNFDNAPYFYREGKIFTGLCVIEYLLADEGPGTGGISVIAGSHKANLTCPAKMLRWEQYQEYVTEINAKAGDAIIFSEACTHGNPPVECRPSAPRHPLQVQRRSHGMGRRRSARPASVLLGRTHLFPAGSPALALAPFPQTQAEQRLRRTRRGGRFGVRGFVTPKGAVQQTASKAGLRGGDLYLRGCCTPKVRGASCCRNASPPEHWHSCNWPGPLRGVELQRRVWGFRSPAA